jgi:hypothetical protein
VLIESYRVGSFVDWINPLTLLFPLGCTAEPDTKPSSNNPNDMFAVNTVTTGSKCSITPVNTSNQNPVEGPVTLPNVHVLAMSSWCLSFLPVTLAEIFLATCMTFVLSITICLPSGIIPYPNNGDDIDLSGVHGTVQDGPDGEAIFVLKCKLPPGFFNVKYKRRVLKVNYPGHNQENWGHGLNALEKDVKKKNTDDSKPLYAVCQYQLPFKVLKNINSTDILTQFDSEDGNCSVTFHLFHIDQSGRKSAGLKKCAIFSSKEADK